MKVNKPFKELRDVIYRLRHFTFRDKINKNVKVKLAFSYLWWFFSYKYFGRKYTITLQNGMKSLVYPFPDHDAGEANIFTLNVDYFDNEFVRNNLKKGEYIIDAGCNVGNRTIVLADIIKGAIMIDPTRKAIERAKENLKLNDIDLSNYKFVQKAVSSEPGILELAEHGGASTQNYIIEDCNVETERRKVPVTTIDQLVEEYNIMPSYIKIDVEGFDFKVIQGASETLKKGVRLIRFKNNNKEILMEIKNYLENIGYSLFIINEKGITINYSDLMKSSNIFASPVSKSLYFK